LTPTKEAMVVNGSTVVVSGRSALKTRPFTLAAGSYTFAWQGTPASTGGRNCIVKLASAETTQTHHLLNVILEQRERSETQVYGVKAGQHYFDIDCGVWSVALVPRGQDAQAVLDKAPPPPAVQAPAPAQAPPAEATEWALAFDSIQPLTQSDVYNEAGIPRTQVATGVFQRIFFRAKNKQDKSASIPSSALSLTDDQGRTYTSDFQVRQVQGNGISAPFGGASVVPGATVALNITFDVAPDATGLVLHMKGASSVKVQ
jgi:hypothetical protein